MKFRSSSIAHGENRVADLEAKVDELSRRVAELQLGQQGLTSKLNATTILFENRVDLIYRRVCVDLREFLGLERVDTQTRIEADAVLNKLLLGGLPQDIPVRNEDLRQMVSGELVPGRIASPITLWGFRLNRRRARELGDAVEVYPNEDGICIYGPYKQLKPGSYSITGNFLLSDELEALRLSSFIELDVYSSSKGDVVASVRYSPQEGESRFAIKLDFEWPADLGTGTIEFRVHQGSGVSFRLESFDLELR